MRENIKLVLAFYQSQSTKIIVFTVCAVILIRFLSKSILSVSNCDNARNVAEKAYKVVEKVS